MSYEDAHDCGLAVRRNLINSFQLSSSLADELKISLNCHSHVGSDLHEESLTQMVTEVADYKEKLKCFDDVARYLDIFMAGIGREAKSKNKIHSTKLARTRQKVCGSLERIRAEHSTAIKL